MDTKGLIRKKNLSIGVFGGKGSVYENIVGKKIQVLAVIAALSGYLLSQKFKYLRELLPLLRWSKIAKHWRLRWFWGVATKVTLGKETECWWQGG